MDGAVAFAYREMADHVVESHDFVAILNGTTAEPIHAAAFCEAAAGSCCQGENQSQLACPP